MIEVMEVVAYQAHDGKLFIAREPAEQYNHSNYMATFAQRVHKATGEERPTAFQVLNEIVSTPICPDDLTNAEVQDFIILVAKPRGLVHSTYAWLRDIVQEKYAAATPKTTTPFMPNLGALRDDLREQGGDEAMRGGDNDLPDSEFQRKYNGPSQTRDGLVNLSGDGE